MKYLAAMLLVAASATASFAEAPCKRGNPNVFKFISWDVKPGKDEGGNDFAAFTLTFHNTLDKNLITATFGAEVNDKDGKPILSWRVALLPYIEEYPLHTQFRLDEPWDSPHNKQVSETTPRCYRPILGHSDDPGLTRYQALVGPGTAFERPGLTWDDFPDGRGSTLLVVEAGDPVPWSKPADLAYDPNGPLPRLGAGYTKPVHFLCREVRREPIFVAVFADGSVRFIRSSTDEGVLRAVITRNGGESVDVSGLE